MKSKIGKIILGSIVGIVAVTIITSSIVYNEFVKASDNLLKDFTNWGGEFIDD